MGLIDDSNWNTRSDAFEKVALKRLRDLIPFLSPACNIYREIWDCSTVLCLDFAACPERLQSTLTQASHIQAASTQLRLADSLKFMVGNKVVSLKTTSSPDT